jgi:putative spermidine/putrescine transport system permease protein
MNHRNRLEHLLLGSYVLLFCLFLLAPILIVVAVSFTPSQAMVFPFEGFSLRWYHRIVDYKPFMKSFGTSLYLALFAATLAILIAVPCALAMARARGRVANAFMAFLLSPLAIPPLVIGLSLLYYLSKIGITASFPALLIAHTVVSVPYIMRTVLAVYRNVDANYTEAALVLGASRAQTFVHVTLPLIAPGIFAGSLFAVLVSIDNLGVSYFFGTADVTTLPVVMLSYLQNQFDPAIAAISTVQMVVTLALLLVVERTYGLRALTTQ